MVKYSTLSPKTLVLLNIVGEELNWQALQGVP